MSQPWSVVDGGVLLRVRLTPKGGRDQLDGVGVDSQGHTCIRARVSAPPADGEANAALIRLIAKTFRLPKSAIEIRSGQSAREKALFLAGEEIPGLLREKFG